MLVRLRWLWTRNFLACEFLAGLTVATATVAGVRLFGLGDFLQEKLTGNKAQVYAALLGAFVSALGFLMAVAALIAQCLTMPKFEPFRQSPVYPQVWETFFFTLFGLFIGAAVAGAALVFDRDNEGRAPALMYATWWAIIACSCLCGRCVWIFANIVRLTLPHVPESG